MVYWVFIIAKANWNHLKSELKIRNQSSNNSPEKVFHSLVSKGAYDPKRHWELQISNIFNSTKKSEKFMEFCLNWGLERPFFGGGGGGLGSIFFFESPDTTNSQFSVNLILTFELCSYQNFSRYENLFCSLIFNFFYSYHLILHLELLVLSQFKIQQHKIIL